MTPLSPAQARKVYDRIGRLQDSQAFYEDAAIERMLVLADLESATSVLELGCGTGRLARRLLESTLPPEAGYMATEISPRMSRIAAERLRPWADRATVAAIDPGDERLPGDDGAFDRFVATYVFDLLDDADARRLLGEAARLLGGDGRLCAVGITPGRSGLTRVVMNGWERIARTFPPLVGGCRPVDLRRLLDDRWSVIADEVVTRWGVSSQVLVANARG